MRRALDPGRTGMHDLKIVGLSAGTRFARARRRLIGCLRGAAFILAATALVLAAARASHACACCTHVGWRSVGSDTLKDWRLAQVEALQFARTATLSLGEADPEIKGVTDPSTDYELAVTRAKGRMVFTLRDQKGRVGNLVLALPRTVSMFEVDTRDEDKDGGLGPLLYKEWKLTADAAGDGLFSAEVKRQKVTLVLHGRGRGCPDVAQFTAWTLMLHTAKQGLTLIGTLDSGRK
jgi:hypothetical protein